MGPTPPRDSNSEEPRFPTHIRTKHKCDQICTTNRLRNSPPPRGAPQQKNKDLVQKYETLRKEKEGFERCWHKCAAQNGELLRRQRTM